MSLELDVPWLLMVVLGTMRMAVVLMFTPVFGGVHVPGQARMAMLLALSAAMLAARPQPVPADLSGPGQLFMLGMTELLTGAVMAFGLQCAFGTLSLAGRMLDLQVGFSVGAMFDPVTRAPSPMLDSLMTMLGVFVFYAVDGHHLLIRVVALSFERLPVGSAMPWQAAQPFVEQFGTVFALGLTLAAPVLVALFLVDVGLGIVSRTMPQMNVFLIGFIVKIMVGMLVFMAALSGMIEVMRRIFASGFTFLQALLP